MEQVYIFSDAEIQEAFRRFKKSGFTISQSNTKNKMEDNGTTIICRETCGCADQSVCILKPSENVYSINEPDNLLTTDNEHNNSTEKLKPGEEESVNEAAERFGSIFYKKDQPDNTYNFHEGFKSGANWQNEKVIELLESRIKQHEITREGLGFGLTKGVFSTVIDELKDILTKITIKPS